MTHKEIAKLANVSVSTVSKALSGSRDISEEITKEIVQIAINIGYFKEKSKKSLERQKSKSILIGIVCPEIISIHYSKIITFIKQQVEKSGGQVGVYITDFNENKKDEILQMLLLRNCCDGIILFGRYSSISKPNIPIMCIDCPCPNPLCDTIISDFYAPINDAVIHLKNLGHTKMGFIGEPKTQMKQENFIRALKANNIEVNDNFIYNFNARFEEIGIAAAEAVFKSTSYPTAFIAAYDEIALAFIHKLTKNGFKVPDDISVIGINDIPFSSYAQTPLTTVKTMYEDAIPEAVDFLFAEILHNLPTGNTIKLNYKLIIRETTSEVKHDKL